MEYHIIASTCEDADKEMNKVIDKMWKGALQSFQKAQNEEENQNIVNQVIRRGYLPLDLYDKDARAVYNAMQERISPKKVSHHAHNSIISDRSHQKE